MTVGGVTEGLLAEYGTGRKGHSVEVVCGHPEDFYVLSYGSAVGGLRMSEPPAPSQIWWDSVKTFSPVA